MYWGGNKIPINAIGITLSTNVIYTFRYEIKNYLFEDMILQPKIGEGNTQILLIFY